MGCEFEGGHVLPDKIDDIMETISPQAKDAFSQAADELRQWGYNKGIRQTAIKMIKKGYSDEQIAEITDIDVKRLKELRSELSH